MPTLPSSVTGPRRALCRGSATPTPSGGFRVAAFAVLLGAARLAGCAKSDVVAGTTPDIGGAYTLRVVGADSLPATVFDSTAVDGIYRLRVTIAITGGTMTLSRAGGYIFRLTYTLVVSGVAQPVSPLGDRGTYTREGSTLSFTSSDTRETMSGTLEEGKLTMAQDLLDDGAPLSLVYQR